MIQFNLKDNSIFSKIDSDAVSLGKAAFVKVKENKVSPPTPLYLKKSSAEILLEEKSNGNNN